MEIVMSTQLVVNSHKKVVDQLPDLEPFDFSKLQYWQLEHIDTYKAHLLDAWLYSRPDILEGDAYQAYKYGMHPTETVIWLIQNMFDPSDLGGEFHTLFTRRYEDWVVLVPRRMGMNEKDLLVDVCNAIDGVPHHFPYVQKWHGVYAMPVYEIIHSLNDLNAEQAAVLDSFRAGLPLSGYITEDLVDECLETWRDCQLPEQMVNELEIMTDVSWSEHGDNVSVDLKLENLGWVGNDMIFLDVFRLEDAEENAAY